MENIEQNICNDYLNNNNIKFKDLSNKYGVTNTIIKLILYKNNIKRNFKERLDIRKYTHTYNFFENINNEIKAYWLGFILADGYIDSSGAIGIELEVKDILHLEKFKLDICATNPVRIYHKNSTFGEQDNCRILLNSNITFFNLIDLGITINKSDEGVMPNVEENLKRHLVRGYFDGNGSISIDYNRNVFNVSICGTKEILQDIENISEFNWNWSKRILNNTNNYQISVGRKNDGYKFLNYIYDNSNVYLERKYQKYKDII